jgi:hypothetical protein
MAAGAMFGKNLFPFDLISIRSVGLRGCGKAKQTTHDDDRYRENQLSRYLRHNETDLSSNQLSLTPMGSHRDGA